MKLSFDFDEADWKLYLHYIMRQPALQRTMRRRQVLCTIAFGFLAISFAFRSGKTGDSYIEVAGFGALAVFFAIFYPRWFVRSSVWVSIKRMRKEDNRNLFCHRDVELTPEGIRSSSRAGEMFYRSDAIIRVVETPELLLLFIADMQAIVFPRAKIEPVDYARAVEFSREHYEKDAA